MDTFVTCQKCDKQTFYTKKHCDFCGEELVKPEEVKKFLKQQEDERLEKEKLELQINNEQLDKEKKAFIELQKANSFIKCLKCGKETFNTRSRCDFCHEKLDKKI